MIVCRDRKMFSVWVICVGILLTGKSVLAQTVTLSDCREIEDRLARFDCYESIQEPATSQTSPVETQSRRVAEGQDRSSAGDINAPETNKDVVRQQAPSAPPAAVMDDKQEKKSLLKRIWPFGGSDKDNDRGYETEQGEQDQVATTSSAIDKFGNSATKARVVDKADGDQELHDQIASLEQLGANQWLITLESGQTWRQMISKRYRLKVGDSIRIYPTAWGSNYRLTADRLQSYIQVARVE